MEVFAKRIWVKVFKNGSSKIFGRHPLKILLDPFLNTLAHIRPCQASIVKWFFENL